MSFSLDFLEEVRGDNCRLGYLKLLSCLGDDYQPYSLDYFSSRLLSLTKDHQRGWSFPPELSDTGLITDKQGMTISRNYVNFSYSFGVLNPRNQTLGAFGRFFSKTETAKNTLEYMTNPGSRSKNILVLSEFERILFLKQLLEVDGLAISHILRWLYDLNRDGQDEIGRGESMNYFMEQDYPKIMSILSLNSRDYPSKMRFKEQAERALNFEKERIRLDEEEKKSEKNLWNVSELYAKYRHTAPPRFEWLIDLGLLAKKARGCYQITPLCGKVHEAITGKTLDYFKDEAFSRLAEIYLDISKETSEDNIRAILFDSYTKFERAGYLTVDRIQLENFVAFRTLELKRESARISSVDRVIEDMHRQDPGLIQYHIDANGKWRFIKITKKT